MLMYGQNSRTDTRFPAQKVPFEYLSVQFQRRVWIHNNRSIRGSYRVGSRGIICHIFYTKYEHIASECTLTLREQVWILKNYDSLKDTEIERVTDDSQNHAKVM